MAIIMFAVWDYRKSIKVSRFDEEMFIVTRENTENKSAS